MMSGGPIYRTVFSVGGRSGEKAPLGSVLLCIFSVQREGRGVPTGIWRCVAGIKVRCVAGVPIGLNKDLAGAPMCSKATGTQLFREVVL